MPDTPSHIELAADIVSAYVSHNSVPAADLPQLLGQIHSMLVGISSGAAPSAGSTFSPNPAVPIKRSITKDYLICLEDGRRFKSLKRHLRAQYDMSPEQYREKWRLPPDYPMVAPAYAEARSTLARQIGLGQKRRVRKTRKPATASLSASVTPRSSL
jgi:MucR family transcriptional regulator, transcriptional regulator of exopolysaccharide biosynthesis